MILAMQITDSQRNGLLAVTMVVSACQRRAGRARSERGQRRTGPSGGLYDSELFQQDRGEAIVFIPVEGTPRVVGRVAPFVVPAAELAVITHHGSLDDVDLTYAELGSYTTTHEISVDGPLREYYLRDSHDTPDPAGWETEIGWPIFRADDSR